jgi:barstar (barnase inhibitor)
VPIAEIDLREVDDWDSFHDVSARGLGFPDYYGRNMNAWIDCLTYGDDSMTALEFSPGEPLTLQLLGCKPFRDRCPALFESLVDCAAFVNWRRIKVSDPPLLMLSYD